MEKALGIQLGEEQLLGIVHHPEPAAEVGMVLVVGGPQYRVGSHRQFVQLSRALARQGIASMRFDYRGMGDSEGEKQPFDAICADIRAACDAFAAETGIRRIVLWGLCDAASAAMIYAHKDTRIEGLVLLNPWLRSESTMGQTMVRHYYLKRLLSAEFWRKLLRGGVQVTRGLRDAGRFVRAGMARSDREPGSYQARMQWGIGKFPGRACLVLSGEDLTAREFEQQALGQGGWPELKTDRVQVQRIQGSDHTFSTSSFKGEVEAVTREFIESLS